MKTDKINLTVEYAYSPAIRGARDSMGVPIEPDDDEEVAVESVTDEYGVNVELPDDALEKLENHILEWIHSED